MANKSVQFGQESKAATVDFLAWNGVPDPPEAQRARLYYDINDDALHAIDSDGVEIFDSSITGGGAVSSVFGRTGDVAAQDSDYSAFYVDLNPTFDQSINGAFTLSLLNGPNDGIILDPVHGTIGLIAFGVTPNSGTGQGIISGLVDMLVTPSGSGIAGQTVGIYCDDSDNVNGPNGFNFLPDTGLAGHKGGLLHDSGSGLIFSAGTITLSATNSTSLNSNAGALVAGNATFTVAAPTVAAGQIGYGSTTAATATAGGGQAALATVLGYIVANVAGVSVRIPYFSA